jgi:hypothetical protein
MLDEHFVILGASIGLLGSIGYARDTINGKTKPNRVTWFIWALAPLIAFAAEVQDGVGLRSLMTFEVGFGPLLVFLSSFVNPQSYWKISRLDIGCGLLSLLALALWRLTAIGDLAIALCIASDLLAAIPTLVKSYKEPYSESLLVFVLGGINATITLLTIEYWTFATAGFPVYIVSICAVFILLIKFPHSLGRGRVSA